MLPIRCLPDRIPLKVETNVDTSSSASTSDEKI